MLEHKPFVGNPYEHGVGVEVKNENSQQVLELLEAGPLDYGEIRDKTGFDDDLLNSTLNLLRNYGWIEAEGSKWKLSKIEQ